MLALLLPACVDPPAPACEVGGPHLVVASTDYESGVLGAVALDGTCLAEPLASAGRDPLLRAAPDALLYADRSDGDVVRRYDPGVYDVPAAEFALPAGGNTHDVVAVGEELFFARYDEPWVTVTDRAGRVLDRIDLADDADADGLPEADAFAWVDGRLFLSLQRLDRDAGFVPAGPGRLLELDPATRRIVARHDTGPNPRLWPADGAVLVGSGAFGALDGSLVRHSIAGEPELLATEQDLGFDLTWAREVGGVLVLLGLDPAETAPSHVRCGPVHERTESWPVDATVAPDGVVWGVDRPMDWAGTGRSAAWRLDPATCVRETVAEGFLLGPASVALPPGG